MSAKKILSIINLQLVDLIDLSINSWATKAIDIAQPYFLYSQSNTKNIKVYFQFVAKTK